MVDVKNNVSKEEWETRQDLAAFYRTIPYFGWDDLILHISLLKFLGLMMNF